MISLNTQPVEKRDYRDDGSLEIVGKPWLTLQGEGPFAGTPAVFIRLAGCQLLCPQCDTDYTSNRQRYPLKGWDGLLTMIEATRAGNPVNLVVITGGEPFRQYLPPLCWELLTDGYRVQIETNGAYAPPVDLPLSHEGGHCVDIVCSPKTPKIHPDLEPWIGAYKYVLDADHIDPDDGLPTDVLGTGLRPARPCILREVGTYEVFLQPLDEGGIGSEKSLRNQRAAIESCMKHDYRFSFQLHKFLGLE